MFVPTDRQRSLLECQFLLPPEKVSRLEKSWAAPFRKRVLPLIDEEVFRDAFSSTTGRPNKSIRLLAALHLLKEWNDLTDEQVIDHLEYNLQWHYALGIESDTAHVCQKTLHNFRVLLMDNERAQQVFEDVTLGLAKMDGLGLGRQRLDSTHVISNIAVLTRLGLFVETVTNFLKELRKLAPDTYSSLDAGYGRRYLDREGYFSDAKREQARRRLPVVARDVDGLVVAFENDEVVSSLPAFGLLRRLFEEQCEVVTASDDDETGTAEDGSPQSHKNRVKLRDPKSISSGSLQSPHDPDVTFGHKGKGYEVQVSETCDEENPYQLITGTAVNGANESDQNAVQPMLDQLEESGMAPDEMLADTGYGSGTNIVESAERGVNLHAPVQDPNASKPADHFQRPVSDKAQAELTPSTFVGPVKPKPKNNSSKLLELAWFSFDETCAIVFSCPAGHPAVDQHISPNNQLIARFPVKLCSDCPLASLCPTRLLTCGDRQLRRSRPAIATGVRQAEQRSSSFKDDYKIRSGIESTNQELKGRHGLGDLRIRGKPRMELVVWLKSLALNVKRATQWHVSLMINPAANACLT